MSAARALVIAAADTSPATAAITFLANFFMFDPLSSVAPFRASDEFVSHLELNARSEFIEILTDLVRRNGRNRAGRRQLLHVDDVVVEHDADVLVQIPVERDGNDSLLAAGDA